MKVIISGYGRMGKMIERISEERTHKILALLDTEADWKQLEHRDLTNAVVIDFSLPEVAVPNLYRCFNLGLPVVTGTTGWYGHLEEVKATCTEQKGSLFYAPNFSLGVNLFFYVNKIMAKAMAQVEGYRCSMKEIHHIHKLDAPSGTAIKTAEDILAMNPNLTRWVNQESSTEGELPIESVREDEVPGTHEVFYDSEVDILTLKHEARSRKGFALGAVLAAEFLLGKKGIFTMEDYLKTLGIN
ncbi:MAG: 4-hydroxy-tetrahydrodipicolinate reductase [Bacteroidales bacterium]|nr:4-hydroxy-tetrahydrodipicolinate reductase [Bacteroidales bacterium]